MVSAGVPAGLFHIKRRPQNFLLYFGRLDVFHKGIDTLLEAIAMIATRLPSIELRIAGRGPVDRISALVDTAGLANNVRVLGAVSDAERDELLATAAIQIMPSRFEGFGLAAAEAMAAGVPLIATDVGSLPEVLDPPRGGRLVPASDPVALASAIEDLLADDDARALLSESARRSARRFDWDAVAEAHMRFLSNIAKGAMADRSKRES
jgi:phosphatidylinositol alpha-mannosyltransferase